MPADKIRRPPPETCTESEWQSWVVYVARRYGWRVMHVYRAKLADGSWRTTTSSKGWPDLTAVRGDRIVFAELKDLARPVEPDQDEWLDALAAVCSHVHVFVWRPGDWRDVIAMFSGLTPETA